MNRFLPKLVGVALLVLAAAGIGRAAPPTEAEKKLVKDVADKLLAVCPPPPAEFNWPPDVGIQESPSINAFAGLFQKDGQPVKKDGKYLVGIRVTTGMMTKVIDGDEDRLAFVLGHELGHALKRHLPPKNRKVPFLQATFDRGEEDEADQTGVELMLKAGYSLERAMKAITKMQQLGLDYSSFEGLGVGHPSWNDRAAKIDKEKSHLWKAMSAFHNGVVFLATEQYEAAALCFDKVTKEFPSCYEAWANLGYARLMVYSDKWSTDDIRDQGIGQVVIGGFYTRVESVTVRGKDSKMWFGAVGALREANRLKKGQTIVLANLGLAYLLHPDGKDVGEAERYFTEAEAAAKTDKALHPLARASLLVNRGVTTIADGKTEKGLTQLNEAEAAVREFAGGLPGTRLPPAFDSALTYTRALALAEKKDKADQEKARALFETYLTNTSSLSLWWTPAYEQYEELCKAVGKEPKTKEAFTRGRPDPVRLVASVALKSGTPITLGDDIEDLTKTLGRGKETIAVPGTTLRRLVYEKDGVELLCNDTVLAITLTGPNAPTIPLRGKMVGGGTAGALKVGMTEKELTQLLGGKPHPCELVAPEKFYDYYRDQGVAVRVVDGKVVELVIVQLPKGKEKK